MKHEKRMYDVSVHCIYCSC